MTPDEKRAYSRGYAAGMRRVEREITDDQIRAAKSAAWLQIFSSCIASAMTMQGWTKGKEQISTVKQRTDLAGEFSDAGLRALLVRFGPAVLAKSRDFRPTYSVTGNGVANRKAEDYLADPKVLSALERISKESDQ